VDVSPATAPRTPRAEYRAGLLSQLSRFVLVGCLAAVVDYGLYQILLHLDMLASVSKAISFICGTTTAYLLNRRFTFGQAAPAGASRFAKFLLLYGTTFFVNVGMNSLSLHFMPDGLPLETSLCWLIAQGTSTCINFLVLRMVVFRHTP
jgi:putative flippase GtrA